MNTFAINGSPINVEIIKTERGVTIIIPEHLAPIIIEAHPRPIIAGAT